jgi:hypothetical protein
MGVELCTSGIITFSQCTDARDPMSNGILSLLPDFYIYVENVVIPQL